MINDENNKPTVLLNQERYLAISGRRAKISAFQEDGKKRTFLSRRMN